MTSEGVDDGPSDWNFQTQKQMTPAEKASLHDFLPYLQLITDELTAVKDRVRKLVKHWPTDGHFKENILRQLLRRHLPESVLIGTGFVVNSYGPSIPGEPWLSCRPPTAIITHDRPPLVMSELFGL